MALVGKVAGVASVAGVRGRPAPSPSCFRLPVRPTSVRTAAQRQDRLERSLTPAGSLEQALMEQPFAEPLVRSLILGVGCGGAVEAGHVLLAAAAAASQAGGLHLLPAALFHTAGALTPLWFVDHAVAIGVWVVLYLMEAHTVSRILDAHPQDPVTAARALNTTPTLARRMFPGFSLPNVKRSWTKMFTGARTTPATARGRAGGQASGAPTTVYRTPSPAPRPSQDAPSTSGPFAAATGTSVLERPTPSVSPRVQDVPTPSAPASRGTTSRPQQSGGSVLDRPGRTSAPGNGRADKREKELKERAAYLQNFWYAACVSSDLKPGKVKEVTMFGRKMALFRDEEGRAVVMEAACPHRGAPLSQGWTADVKGHKCVVCPYHGWAFDSKGVVQDVPSNESSQTLPKRSLVSTYPTEESGGFVWVFYGSRHMPADERPPVPYVPLFDDPAWRPVYAELEFNADYTSVFENALDLAHIHTVHKSSFGNPDNPQVISPAKMDRDTFSVRGSFAIHSKPAHPLLEWTRTPQVPVEVEAFLPASSAVTITLGGNARMCTWVTVTPIDEHRAVARVCLLRDFATLPVLDPWMRQAAFKILKEDQVVVEACDPDSVPTEVSMAVDLPQVEFRKAKGEFLAMGYGVDPKDAVGHKGLKVLNQ